MAGINRAYVLEKSFNSNSSQKDMCFFISHISVDKDFARTVADYIMNKLGIDVYFDELDDELQTAVVNDDSKNITKFIENGITQSTHMICLVTENTKNSWWVPFEIGYGKKSNKEIISFIHNNVKEIPAFLDVTIKISSIFSLEMFELKYMMLECFNKSNDISYNCIDVDSNYSSNAIKYYLKE